MGINPVSEITSTGALADGSSSKGEHSQTAKRSVQKSEAGNSSQQEIGALPLASESSGEQEDEVQVQRSAEDGEIVIRYVDPSGNLILQVPTAEVQGVARAIEQALAPQTREPGAPGSGSEGNEPRDH